MCTYLFGLNIHLSTMAPIRMKLNISSIDLSQGKKDEDMLKLVNHKPHRHARTYKKGEAIFKFNIPLSSMPYTVVLDH